MSTKLRAIMMFIAASLVSLTAIAGPGAHGPHGEHLDAAISANVTSLARLPDGSVNVPKQAQRRMVIRTVMTHEAEHPLTVELNGRVGMDPNAGGRVQAPFGGRIEPGSAGFPVAGQHVKKNQVLAQIRPVSSAIERSNQQAQLAEIRANRTLVGQRLKRLAFLEGTVPQKEIEAARAELTSLVGRERAISGSLAGIETITAPVSGIVASANVLHGQIVEARDVLFDIVDPARMVVEATTTDVTLANRIGKATLANYHELALTLLGGGRSLRDSALPISFRITAKNIPLAIGQPVTVIAQLAEKIKGIPLPAKALVRNQNNEPIIWLKSGSERFIAQPVEFKPLDADTILVVKGLVPENRVVVAGATLINQIR